jgi:very-short-patch-repair endonuclease
MRRATVPDVLSCGPFTTRTAAAAGVTRNGLSTRAWRQLFRNVWIAAHVPADRATWLAAARLVLPVDAVLVGLSAAEQHGVDVRHEDDVEVHSAVDRPLTERKRRGITLRRLELATDEVQAVGRWLVTTPLRTAFDCARWLPLVDAVVVVDAMAHANLLDPSALTAFAKAHPGVRWVTRVADVVKLADPRAESPMETRLRLLLVRAGFTAVQPQFVVRDAAGRFVARLDLAFPDARVAVEYDGAWHWQQRRHDDRRRDAVRALGWTVIVVSAEDYYRTPDDVLRRVRLALAHAAA